MRSTQHYHWFTFEIQHQYFEHNACPAFQLLPTPTSQRIMKNYGIRIQKQGNRYLAYATIAAEQKIWDELPTQEDLFFELINTDPYFDNYTEVPLSITEEKVLYLTNKQVENRFISEENCSPTTYLPVKGLRFNVPVPKNKATTVVIKDHKGQEVFSQTSHLQQQIVSVNISALDTGVYEIWIDNQLSKKFIGSSEINTTKCYGIVHIQMPIIVASLKENAIPILNVDFLARATYWQYIIMPPSDKKITIQEMHIEGITDTTYKNIGTTTEIGGKEATVFLSEDKQKLQQKAAEHSVLKIQYTNDFSDTLLDLDIKIPIPKPQHIMTQQENNEDVFYSQTIIYV